MTDHDGICALYWYVVTDSLTLPEALSRAEGQGRNAREDILYAREAAAAGAERCGAPK